MKLSELVAYLNHLDRLDTKQSQSRFNAALDPTYHAISTHVVQFGNHSAKLKDICDDIQTLHNKFDDVVSELKQDIRQDIENLEQEYLARSYQLYSENMKNDSVDHMLQRRPALDSMVMDYLRSRMIRYSDWHYPGMILRPGLETWMQYLVALDPMYLVDIDHAMLRPCLEHFPKEYQFRIRPYIIKEYLDPVSLVHLPQGQMAFVLAYNYFNYKPIEVIRDFLREIFGCLRPGGVLAFTFNDCDRWGGVEMAERYYACYTPGRLILAAAELTGYEIVHRYDIDAGITWLELRRPGELRNLRGGQSLSRIRPESSRAAPFASNITHQEEP